MAAAIRILLFGASGHAHSVLSVLQRHGGYVPVGLIDSFKPVGVKVHGITVLGGENEMPQICTSNNVNHVMLAIGDNFRRHALISRIRRRVPQVIFPSLVDPSATVAYDAQLSPGVVIMPLAHIGAGCTLDFGALVNTSASLDHDSVMGPCSSLAPGVVTGGGACIGERSSVGLGAKLIQRITIGADTVIGAGSLVLRDIPSGVVAYGSPARVVRTRQPDDLYL